MDTLINDDIVSMIVPNKHFYYLKENKTLYSLENGAPGVSDLMSIYLYFMNFKYIYKYEKHQILNNIFTIKRSGDYLQILYCKDNNYIYVSNDRMSASFCYLENCEFIGPFSECGIYIRKHDNILCNSSTTDNLTDYDCN